MALLLLCLQYTKEDNPIALRVLLVANVPLKKTWGHAVSNKKEYVLVKSDYNIYSIS